MKVESTVTSCIFFLSSKISWFSKCDSSDRKRISCCKSIRESQLSLTRGNKTAVRTLCPWQIETGFFHTSWRFVISHNPLYSQYDNHQTDMSPFPVRLSCTPTTFFISLTQLKVLTKLRVKLCLEICAVCWIFIPLNSPSIQQTSILVITDAPSLSTPPRALHTNPVTNWIIILDKSLDPLSFRCLIYYTLERDRQKKEKKKKWLGQNGLQDFILVKVLQKNRT